MVILKLFLILKDLKMLTLNIGCGNRTFDEYHSGYKCINYDKRSSLEKVDIL